MFRIILFMMAAVVLTLGGLLVRNASAGDQNDKPRLEQTEDLPDSVRPKRKLYA